MPRTKEKRKILHQPSTHEIFYCLGTMPGYCKLLAANSADKQYANFLQWLIDKDFYNDRPGKVSIKKIAEDFNANAG